MCGISDKSRSIDNYEACWEVGYSGEVEKKTFIKTYLGRANSVSLTSLFQIYNVRIDPTTQMTTCPFSFHKGGRERTASFRFYSETNTFFCFGCKSSGGPVDFVAKMDNLNLLESAKKINESNFQTNVAIPTSNDFQEKLKVLVEFSDLLRNYFESSDAKEQIKAFEASKTLDNLLLKHGENIPLEGLQKTILMLKTYLERQ